MSGKKQPLSLLIIISLITINFSACLTTGLDSEEEKKELHEEEPFDEGVVVGEASGAEQEFAVILIAADVQEYRAVPFKTHAPALDRRTAVPPLPKKKVVLLPKVKVPGPVDLLPVEAFSTEADVSEVLPEAVIGKSFLSVLFDEPPEEVEQASEIESQAVQAEAPESQVLKVLEPVPASVASVPPPKPAGFASEDASGDIEEIKAFAGEVFSCRLEGEGWILETAAASVDGDTDGIRFNGREYQSGETIFYFYPFSENIFIIKFRFVDYSSETSRSKIIRAVVGALETEGKAAGLQEEAGDSDASPMTGDAESAGTGESVLEPEAKMAVPFIPEDVEGLIHYTEGLIADGKCREVAGILEDKIEQVNWMEQDRLYFALAELYQNCDSVRDERQAIVYYKHIVDYYPVSNYWEISKERINYLERYFIDIR
jgi:hypothetical protein